MNEKLEERLNRIEKALTMITEILTRLIEENTESKSAKTRRAWFKREIARRGRWLDLYRVGFSRP